MTKGVIYIAFGSRYVNEAIFSARSLKRVSPLPVTLFTDQPLKEACFDSVVTIAPSHRRAKVDFISCSPYDQTLYLDSDTEIQRDITDVFDVLQRFDIAAVHDHYRKSGDWASKIPAYANIPYAFPEYNGGVLLFKKCAGTDAFFENWRACFYQNIDLTNGRDQASLRISLWNSDLHIHSLPPEFNVRNEAMREKIRKKALQAEDEGLLKPRIFHWHKLDGKKRFARFRSRYRPMEY